MNTEHDENPGQPGAVESDAGAAEDMAELRQRAEGVEMQTTRHDPAAHAVEDPLATGSGAKEGPAVTAGSESVVLKVTNKAQQVTYWVVDRAEAERALANHATTGTAAFHYVGIPSTTAEPGQASFPALRMEIEETPVVPPAV